MLKITLVTIGNKMPVWVDQAVKDYAKRLQDGVSLTIVEIPLMRRGKSTDLSRILEKEMSMMSAAIPNNARLIAATTMEPWPCCILLQYGQACGLLQFVN